MQPNVFNASTDVEGFLSAHIAGTQLGAALPASDCALLARELAPLWHEAVDTVRSPHARPAHVAGLRWVIRDEDLKLFDTILDGVKTSAGAGFFVLAGLTPIGATAAAIGIAAAFLKLIYNARKKGAFLSERDYSLIATLLSEPAGLTEEEILVRLSSAESGWTVAMVRESLAALADVSTASGRVSMVWKSADGRWRTAGL